MRVVRLAQGTLPWHQWRHEGLGGSDVAAVLEVSPYEGCTPEDVFAEKILFRPKEPTFAMRRGTKLEPIARDLFERRTGWRFQPCCVEHDDEPWIRASLDGLGQEFVNGVELLEIKAPKWQDHDGILAGIVPEWFLVQCQWQLLATGADVCHLVSFNDGGPFAGKDQLAHVVIEADPERQAAILDVARMFWERVTTARQQRSAA